MGKVTIKRWSTGRWYLTYLALAMPAYGLGVWLIPDGIGHVVYSVVVVIFGLITTERLEVIDLMRQADARIEELKRESEGTRE